MDKRLFCLLITTATVVATVPVPIPVPVPAPAPAPADDCTWAFSKVTDCTTYLLNGSADDDPSAPCCGGVTSIVKTAPECICTVVEMASHLGLSLNMTMLLHLPQVCKVSLPPGVGDCDVDLSPSPSPSPSPSSSIIPPSPSPAPGTPPTPPVAEPPTPGTSPTPPVAEPPTTIPPSSPAPPVDEPPTPNPPSPPLASESSTSSSKLQSGSFMVLISLAVAGLSISHF